MICGAKRNVSVPIIVHTSYCRNRRFDKVLLSFLSNLTSLIQGPLREPRDDHERCLQVPVNAPSLVLVGNTVLKKQLTSRKDNDQNPECGARSRCSSIVDIDRPSTNSSKKNHVLWVEESWTSCLYSTTVTLLGSNYLLDLATVALESDGKDQQSTATVATCCSDSWVLVWKPVTLRREELSGSAGIT